MYGVLSYVTRGHSFTIFSICDQSVIHLVLYHEMEAEIVQEGSLMASGGVSLFGELVAQRGRARGPGRTLFLGGVP